MEKELTATKDTLNKYAINGKDLPNLMHNYLYKLEFRNEKNIVHSPDRLSFKIQARIYEKPIN